MYKVEPFEEANELYEEILPCVKETYEGSFEYFYEVFIYVKENTWRTFRRSYIAYSKHFKWLFI